MGQQDISEDGHKLEHQLALSTQTEIILTTGLGCKIKRKEGARLSVCSFCTIYLLELFLGSENFHKGACTGECCQPHASWMDCHVSWGRGGRKEGMLGQAAWLRDIMTLQFLHSAKCPASYSHKC